MVLFEKTFEGKSIELSPSNYVSENLPPSIIFHGTNDKTIPISIIEDLQTIKSKGNRHYSLKMGR